jgi:hypothetical protein
MKYIFLINVFCITLMGCATASRNSLESTQPYSITLDYGRTIEDLLLSGSFNWTHPEITAKRFPSTETGVRSITIILTELPKYLTMEKTIEYQKQRQFRPATIKELLAFAQAYPKAQLDHAIVCLGSSCTFYAKERSTSADRTFGLQTTQNLPRSDQTRLQTFWPYLDRQGSLRIVDLGQISFMRQDQLQTYWGCFVGTN